MSNRPGYPSFDDLRVEEVGISPTPLLRQWDAYLCEVNEPKLMTASHPRLALHRAIKAALFRRNGTTGRTR